MAEVARKEKDIIRNYIEFDIWSRFLAVVLTAVVVGLVVYLT